MMQQIGDTRLFAIESDISIAYPTLGLRALGYFVIYINGFIYGVKKHDATMLACSLAEVERRIVDCGKHTASFAQNANASEIADAAYGAIYGSCGSVYPNFGYSKEELRSVIESNRLFWAPDGDQAFDDGSFVLHFDIGHRVRLLGFKLNGQSRSDPSSLREVYMPAKAFYSILEQWCCLFGTAWNNTPKSAI